jgi:hypothetical protein
MYEQVMTCQKCQSGRSADLKSPCSTCGARSTIFGYLYEHEFKTFLWAIIIVSVFIIIACVSGLVFLATQSFLLSN